jgi:hypothetical protein
MTPVITYTRDGECPRTMTATVVKSTAAIVAIRCDETAITVSSPPCKQRLPLKRCTSPRAIGRTRHLSHAASYGRLPPGRARRAGSDSKEVMGHRNIATTQRYTHLRPVHEIPAHERLADAVPIADLVTVARKRASGKGVGKNDGTLSGTLGQTSTKTAPDRQTLRDGRIRINASNTPT